MRVKLQYVQSDGCCTICDTPTPIGQTWGTVGDREATIVDVDPLCGNCAAEVVKLKLLYAMTERGEEEATCQSRLTAKERANLH
jgi:hypothetical protein